MLWLRHGATSAVVLWWVGSVCGIALWQYLLLFVWPGTSLTLLRSFAEHRPAKHAAHRSAIVEAGPAFRLLYLNNNYHALHHQRPALPWYELPAAYHRQRERLLRENGGYLFAGYGQILRRYLLRAKDTPVHPGP